MHWHRQMSIQGSGSDDLFVQVQSAPAQASSQRHVGFGQETEGYSMLFDAIRGFFFMIRCLISASDVTREFYTCVCMERLERDSTDKDEMGRM